MRISYWSSDVCSSGLLAAFALLHARQEREDHAHRAEIVQLHRAFEVMEAGGRLHDRAPDRASGVVDENVDVAKVAQDLGAAFVDRFQIGQNARVDMRFATGLFANVARLFELLAGTGDENDPGAHSRQLLRTPEWRRLGNECVSQCVYGET